MTASKTVTAFLCWVIGLGTACAQISKTCNAVDLEPNSAVEFKKVTATFPKLNFVKGAEAGAACPSSANSCRNRSFLLAGDLVLAGVAYGDFVCAEFTSAKGVVTAGFLPVTSLEPANPPEVPLRRWLGKWRSEAHQEITIKRGKQPGELEVSGEATYGSDDPVRVKNGAVNEGSFSALVKPRGPLLEIATDTSSEDEPSKPFDSKEDYLCKLRIDLQGNALSVEDSGICGGMNVRFNNFYYRH